MSISKFKADTDDYNYYVVSKHLTLKQIQVALFVFSSLLLLLLQLVTLLSKRSKALVGYHKKHEIFAGNEELSSEEILRTVNSLF